MADNGLIALHWPYAIKMRLICHCLRGKSRFIYVESVSDIASAIAGEKQIKKWGRGKKLLLERSLNPPMEDVTQALD